MDSVQQLMNRVVNILSPAIPFSLEDRIPVTPLTFSLQILLCTPYIYLAYLARRENTYTLRLLILPIVLSCLLWSAWGFVWTTPEMGVSNWGQCLFCGIALAKSLELAFTKEGMLKIGEIRPGVLKKETSTVPQPSLASSHSSMQTNGKANGVCNGSVPPGPPQSFWKGLVDAFELLHTCRGINFQFGQDTPIPPHRHPLDRPAFLRATLRSFLYHFIILDVLNSTIKLLPGVGTPSGGSIFYSQLPLLPTRLIVSTTIQVLTASSLLSGFSMMYGLITLVAVGCFNSSPQNWPPVMGHPWSADSLHRFWARDWHQMLRQTILIYGAYPTRYLVRSLKYIGFRNEKLNAKLENISGLLGVFLASGLWHECSIYAMGRGFEWKTVLFFAGQAGLLVAERAWRTFTGRRVGGLWGRMWVYFVILIVGQVVVDSWHRRGLGGGVVIPFFFSPTRRFVFPLAKALAVK